MRKYNMSIKAALAVFAVVLSACSSDNDITENNPVNSETPVSEEMVFYASMDGGNVTRTDFNSNSTIWAADDAIKIVNLATETPNNSDWVGTFNIRTHSAPYTKEEVFTSTKKINVLGNDADKFFAFYPSTCKVGYTSGNRDLAEIKGTIPVEQTAVKGAYDQSLHFMTAYSTNNTFAFKNVCALIKITLKNYANVKRVRVLATPADVDQTTNTSYIAGDFKAKINQNDGTTTISNGITSSVEFSGNNSPYVELQLPVAGDDCVEGTFYMVVLPASISNGFTLFLEKTDGTIYMRANTSKDKFERNKIYNLGEYDCSSTPTNMSLLEDYVDLGLPSGTLWCTKNVTADSGTSATLVNSIYDAGGYFAWGDLFEKTEYSSSAYTGNSSQYKKDEYTLLYQYDVAYQIQGHLYCMPTYAQIEELYNNCTWVRSTAPNNSNNYGLLFTSNINGKTLWLPTAGYRINEDTQNGVQSETTKTHYWSRSLYKVGNNTQCAYCLDFDGTSLDGHGWLSGWTIGAGSWYDRRFCGKCIRPVLNIPAFK